jgi:glycosyltransferase 2 family protein
MKKTVVNLLKLLISAGLIWLIATHIDFNQCLVSLQKISLPFALLAMLFYTGIQLLSCLRWQIVLEASGAKIPLLTLLANYFSGMFANIFLPGSVGGDFYRVARTATQINDPEVAAASVFLERFLGLVAICILALIGLPLSFKVIGSPDLLVLFVVCTATILAAVTLITNPSLLKLAETILKVFRLGSMIPRFARVQNVLKHFAHQRKALLSATAVALLVQFSIVTYLYMLAVRLEIPISFLDLLLFQPISIVVTLFPISLGGIGVQESLWVYIFLRLGLTAEQGIALSITSKVLGWILSLPGGFFVLKDTLLAKAPTSKEAN